MPTSVVIVSFRAYDELHRCLASLRAGEAEGPGVVVVDQAPDPAALARLRREFPSVTFVEPTENLGFAAGVNLGVRHARGEWILLLNPDCELTPEGVTQLASWLEAHPTIGAIGPRIRDLDGAIQASARRFPDLTTAFAGRSSWLTRAFPENRLSRRNLPMPTDLTEPADVDWVSGACVMVRRRAFDEVQGMDPGFFLYWEDADFGRRLKNAGWKTVYHPRVEAVHAVGASSRFIPVRSAVAFHLSALRYYRKYASAPGRLLAPIVAAALGARLALLLAWNYSRSFVRFVFGRRAPVSRENSQNRAGHEPRSANRRGAA